MSDLVSDIDVALLRSLILPVAISVITNLNNVTKTVQNSARVTIPRIEHPNQFEKIFKAIISKKKKQTLVIAIDNLDRSDSEVVVEVISTIKNFMDIPGCTFIISCDDDALIKHLISTKGEKYEEVDAREFLRKFFQTSISIPPFLDESLEDYIRKLMEITKLPFTSSAVDLLLFATRKNPRKVKQIINKIIALYILAENREQKNIISKGTITENLIFLVKITIINDEWPSLYRQLHSRPMLLDEISDYLLNLTSTNTSRETTLSNRIQKILDNNIGLRSFLESTNPIRVPDIRPFLNFSQESYDDSLPEDQFFKFEYNEGNISEIRSLLSEKTEDYVLDKFKLMISELKHNTNTQRQIPLYNNLRTLIELYSLSPSSIRNTLLTEIANKMTLNLEPQNIRLLDAKLISELIPEMSEYYQNRLLIKYSEIIWWNE